MKTREFCLGLFFCLLAASAQPAPGLPGPPPPRPEYDQSPERGPHHRRVQYVVTNRVDRAVLMTNEVGQVTTNVVPEVTTRTNRYVQLESGLHYWENGQWLETQELIELAPNGAVARQGPHKVAFSANLNTAGAIDLETSDGQRLRSHVVGLGYFDAASGQSVVIAQVQDSLGELLPPNQVIYPDAFLELKADVRYTYTKAGFEQDIILRENPPPPDHYGLNPEFARLEVLTEFLGAPAPVKTARVLRREENAQRRQAMAEPDLVDEWLDFGDTQMLMGFAFEVEPPADQGADPSPKKPKIPVGKRWLRDRGRDFLIEAVEYASLKPLLEFRITFIARQTWMEILQE